MKTEKSASITLSVITVGDLSDFLEELPRSARVSVSVVPRDRPFDSEQSKLTVRWEEEW